MQVAVIHCSPVMQTRLFEPNWVDRTVLHSFAYPRLLWESASWHIGAFVSRAQGDEAVVGIGLVHKGRQFASFERNLDVEDVHIPDQPVPVARVQKQLGRGFADAIDVDGPLSEARGKRLLDALESLAPELKQVVGKLKERIDAAIERGGQRRTAGIAEGRDRCAAHGLPDGSPRADWRGNCRVRAPGVLVRKISPRRVVPPSPVPISCLGETMPVDADLEWLLPRLRRDGAAARGRWPNCR